MNFMPTRHIDLPAAQRAQGELSLAFKRVGPATRIATMYQAGCLKSLLPRPAAPNICEAVTLNISGGVAGGDILATNIALQENAQASIASQAAERIYRALAEPARITTSITLAAGASLEYLPQETILFDDFALTRSLTIDLHETASYLGIESLVFGRLAMGEAVQTGRLRDNILLRRNGKILLQDMTRLEGNIAEKLARTAVADGATAMATIIFTAPGAAEKLASIRAALADAQAGATMLENIMFIRILAPTGAALRNTTISALKILRGAKPLPLVWQEGAKIWI